MGAILLTTIILGQQDVNRFVDCGTAAVYCYCRLQQASTSFADVRLALEKFGSPPYSMIDLQRALDVLGHPVDAIRTNCQNLPNCTPFIAHLQTSHGGHFIACRIDRASNSADFVDNRDTWKSSPDELTQASGWTGVILVPRATGGSAAPWVIAGAGLGIAGALLFGRVRRSFARSHPPAVPS